MAAAPGLQTFDRRRFTGPESSRPISYEAPGNRKGKERLEGDKDRDFQREDEGRGDGDVRPIYLRTGLVTQASGSSYIETGKTKIVCAVYGPLPLARSATYSSKARLQVEVRFAPFALKGSRKVPGRETESSSLSQSLYQSLLPSIRLELLPKSSIEVYLTILESDGMESDGDISAGVTAASVALAEAGIEMYGLVVGCGAVIIPRPNAPSRVILDPTASEVRHSSVRGSVSLSCIPAMGTVTNISLKAGAGVLERQDIKEAIRILRKTCTEIHSVGSAALIESVAERESQLQT